MNADVTASETRSAATAASESGGQFAASVAGAMNFIGNVLGAFAPAVIGWVATEWGWQAAIVVTSLCGMVGAISWVFVRPDRPLPGAQPQPMARVPA
jgi:ACS family glucarate transporter-like MFS transporter